MHPQTIAGRLRWPLPQAIGRDFGAKNASTHAQRRRAALGPDTSGKGAEPLRTGRPASIRGKSGSNVLDSSDESVTAGGPMDTVSHNLGRGRRPGQHSARRVGAHGCRELPRGHGSAARSRSTTAAFRAVGGVTKSDRDSGAAFSELRGLVVVRRVRNDSQQAGRVRGSGISTAQQSSDAAGCPQVGGCGLGERINQSVGTPVDDSDLGAVPLQGFPDGGVRLMRRHPHKFATRHDGGEIVIHSVGDSGPDPGQRSGMVRSIARTSISRGNESLAVGADGGHERTAADDKLQRPGLGGRSGVAP